MDEIKANLNMDETKKELNPVEVEYLQLKRQHAEMKQVPKEKRVKDHGAKLKSLYKRMTRLEKKLPDQDLLSPKESKSAVVRNKEVKSNCFCKYL